jgi:hypothetical protein
MSNMLSALIEIIGTRPLLFNRFGPDAIPLIRGERTGVAGNDPEEWKQRICWNEQRQLFLDAPAVFAMIRDGGRYTKRGRGTLQTAIVATVHVEEERIFLDRFLPEGTVPAEPTAPVFIDVRGVRMKASGARNVRYRLAASKSWRASFHVIWDKSLVSRNQLKAACIDAGKYVGIGDGRTIGFGRFEVSTFEVADADDQTAS